MQILFIHQNIPGQFRHLIADLVTNPDVQVWALGEAARVKANWQTVNPKLRLYGYVFQEKAVVPLNAHLRTTDVNIRRGLAVAKSLETLKTKGLNPDVIYGHPGWGEMLFVRDVFPRARIVNFCEFYFNAEGQDLGFDPEYPEYENLTYEVRAQNMTQSQSLLAGDLGICPTHWQKSRYPKALAEQMEVVFDGVDCNIVKPNPLATFALSPDRHLSVQDEVVTFVNRSLEPHRGFHVFTRTIPEIQRYRPAAQIVIVGGDGTSYSRPLAYGTYREKYSKEIDGRVDWSKVHFVGRIPYLRYLSLLQISTAHVYLSYPFVLSWSLMESMAAGCSIIASNTAPVREVIEDGINGRLVDFFDQPQLALHVADACENRDFFSQQRERARQQVVERYDLKGVCLPELKRLIFSC
jgi:glycosyltransferase involved in cell wall biosynthesis